jgi:ABC-type multidrug transport system fused ATPase/permease subunit
MGLLLGGVLLTGWAASWLRYLQLVRLSGLAMRSVQRLREWVYGHVLRLPMAFFDRAITGQLVSRVTNDTEAVKTLYIQVLFVLLDSSIVLVGTMIAMAWLDWRLMLIVLGLLPAVLGIVWLYQRLSAPAVTRARAPAQRHQRPDGRIDRRHERAAGEQCPAPLRRALRRHQRAALHGARGRTARQRLPAAPRARLPQRGAAGGGDLQLRPARA